MLYPSVEHLLGHELATFVVVTVLHAINKDALTIMNLAIPKKPLIVPGVGGLHFDFTIFVLGCLNKSTVVR